MQAPEQYDTQGYTILRDSRLQNRVTTLRARFENDFSSRFTDDPHRNRNLIKRFGDSLALPDSLPRPRSRLRRTRLALLTRCSAGRL